MIHAGFASMATRDQQLSAGRSCRFVTQNHKAGKGEIDCTGNQTRPAVTPVHCETPQVRSRQRDEAIVVTPLFGACCRQGFSPSVRILWWCRWKGRLSRARMEPREPSRASSGKADLASNFGRQLACGRQTRKPIVRGTSKSCHLPTGRSNSPHVKHFDITCMALTQAIF